MDTSDTSTSNSTTTTTSILSPSARFIIVASLYAAAGAEKAGETSTESSAITAFLQIVAASFLLYKRNPLFRPFKISVCEMIINEWYVPAFVGLAISKAADWLDGFLARKMGINSVVGSYLDPLGDKLGLLGWWYFGMHSSSEELFRSGKAGHISST